MDEAKKHQRLTIGLAIGAIIVIVAVILINHFYLSDAVQLTESGVAARNSKLVSNQDEFKQIQDKLSQDKKFNSLQKFGAWPLHIEDLTYGKDKPFFEPKTK